MYININMFTKKENPNYKNIGMELGIKKCTIHIMKRRKRETM